MSHTQIRIPEKKEKSFEGLGGLRAGINRLSVCHGVVFFGVWNGITTYKAFLDLKTRRKLVKNILFTRKTSLQQRSDRF
jgi:hypothetical protein